MNFLDAMGTLARRWHDHGPHGWEKHQLDYLLDLVEEAVEAWPPFEHGHDEASVVLEKYRRFVIQARAIGDDNRHQGLAGYEWIDRLIAEDFFDPLPECTCSGVDLRGDHADYCDILRP